jgi:hypothetical protein
MVRASVAPLPFKKTAKPGGSEVRTPLRLEQPLLKKACQNLPSLAQSWCSPFGLARLVLPDGPSLAAAAASAATPLFVVHARIFKEDIFVAAFLVLARRADQVAAGAGAAPRHPGRPPHRTCRRLPSLWLPSLHYRCRCGSTLPMSIRARSFLLLSRQAARA